MTAARSILHVDMDAFFASIEQLDDPGLRGLPVLVGYDGPRGVVAAASYEARRFDCHSAQPMAVARRRCPQAVVVPVRFARYREVSRQLFSLLDEFSPAVEPLSVDEAFLDLTGTERLLGGPADVARRIKQRIRSELHLTASVGVAPNKFLAKLASDLEKPDGLVVVRPGDVAALLPPLPIGKLWGVGPVTAKKLAGVGLHTIGDLRKHSTEWLGRLLGTDAEHLLRLAHGLDDRPVVCDREAKSIGHEQTFDTDLPRPADARRVLLEQTEQVGRRLRKHGLTAAAVSLKLRFGDFETITRSATLPDRTDGTAALWAAAADLFDRWCRDGYRPLRLVGISTSKLTRGEGQMKLFADARDQRAKRVDAVTDRIAAKYGQNAIRRGGGLG